MLRKERRRLTQPEQELLDQLKSAGQDLYDMMDMIAPSRERDLAMTRLEEAMMWAEKAVFEAR